MHINDPLAWDAALQALPQPHVLQSWNWGQLKLQQGWEVQRFLWRVAERPVAGAQLLIQQRGRFRLGYVPKGPILDWNDELCVLELLRGLEALARQESLLLLKIDPDVVADSPTGEALVTQLKQRGWRFSFEQIQFRNTMLIDLQTELDTILARMKPKGRYNIRLAVRKGVTVRLATLADLPLLVDMYAETAQRERFEIRKPAYYRDTWRTFMQSEIGKGFIAEVGGEPVAMLIMLHFGKRAWTMYAGSYTRYRTAMPTYLLQWEALRHAQSLGCTTYDMWGAPNELDRRDPLWGVYRLKSSFGAELVSHIGAFDYSPRAWLYRLYVLLHSGAVTLVH
ncbi:MAG: peptidoglycan bridge formation glycyltransferase FemA/FemB family protein [Anaerolineae bacterium]|nr:peptidoglycan bridge formation glycyltransferase FemA/FemB family protein [Anaerolineae bacterium]